MRIEDLKLRFKLFAINTAILIREVSRDTINSAYCNQLIRCSSSTGANYRAACRAKSPADFINKLKIVEEEMDESLYFLELLQYFNPTKELEIAKLTSEGKELLAITIQSIKTSRQKIDKSKNL
jgi:four helix bundle protein